MVIITFQIDLFVKYLSMDKNIELYIILSRVLRAIDDVMTLNDIEYYL